MSTVISKNVQIGADATPSNNFTWYQPSTPDGTVRLGSGNSGSVTDVLSVSSSGLTLSGGTANGVAYLNGSKVLTTGSALTFDGTTLSNTVADSAVAQKIKAASGLLEVKPYVDSTYGGWIRALNSAESGYVPFSLLGSTVNSYFSTNATWNQIGGSEQMRLTSTGLGIGTSSPGYKLQVQGAGAFIGSSATNNSEIRIQNTDSGGGTWRIGDGIATANGNLSVYRTSGVLSAVFDSSGNLGLGVTPSAWSTWKALDISTNGTIASASASLSVGTNFYWNGSNWIYKSSSANAARIGVGNGDGSFQFFTAPSGTAGNAISFTQAMTLNASGKLSLGTSSSPGGGGVQAVISNANGGGLQFDQAGSGGAILSNGGSSGLQFYGYTGGIGTEAYTERARIDSSGNLLVGTTSAVGRFTLENSATTTEITLRSTGGVGTNNRARIIAGYEAGGSDYGGYLAFNTTSSSNANTERARIDGSGNLLVGTTSTTIGTANFGFKIQSDGGALWSRNVNGSAAVCQIYGNAGEFRVYGNGNVQNTNNSYGAISDAKLKENVVETTPKLEKLCQVRVVNYNLIGDYEKHKQIGVIAQELEQIFPGMVDATPDRDAEGNDLGTTTKSVKYSVFVPMLIKAIQEQQAIIDSLKARLDAANL